MYQRFFFTLQGKKNYPSRGWQVNILPCGGEKNRKIAAKRRKNAKIHAKRRKFYPSPKAKKKNRNVLSKNAIYNTEN